MSPFKEKTAIVTGGGSGIGRAVCHLLGEKGAIVVVADINVSAAEATAAFINKAGGAAIARKLDVSREEDVLRLVEETRSEHGKLDYMFNNAGITITGEFQNIQTEHWNRIFAIDFYGVLNGTRAAYAVMLEQGFGHIINTSSTAGLVPNPLQIPYSSAKFAVIGLSASLRHEAAPKGVKISVVCPGLIDTAIWDTTKVTKAKKEIPARLEEILAGGTPFRPIDPEKSAHYILRGVERNKTYIVFPFHARLLWWLHRLYPPLLNFLLGRNVSVYTKD